MRDGYGTRATEASLRPPSGASSGEEKRQAEAASRRGRQTRSAKHAKQWRQAEAIPPKSISKLTGTLTDCPWQLVE